ncbi:hypothetical protein DBR43_33090 [Pedobacter sp. KBW06]|nr:hypothetical protein DBR43_33090 [Pedobacter sp. KBW06]
MGAFISYSGSKKKQTAFFYRSYEIKMNTPLTNNETYQQQEASLRQQDSCFGPHSNRISCF